MLPPDLDHIGSPLRGVEQQGQCKTGSTSDRMPCLKGRDVGLSPGVEAGGLELWGAHTRRRIISAQTHQNSVPHQRPQRAQEVQCGARGFASKKPLDVISAKARYALVAMLGTEALEDLSSCSPGTLGMVGEPRRAKVAGNGRGHSTRLDPRRADLDARSLGHRSLICRHKLRTPRKSRQRHFLVTGPAEVEARPPMTIDIAMNVFGRPAHQRRSHSFTSWVGESCARSSPVTTSMSPCALTFTPTTCSPAAITALTALVRSLWRKLAGRRVIANRPGCRPVDRGQGRGPTSPRWSHAAGGRAGRDSCPGSAWAS